MTQQFVYFVNGVPTPTNLFMIAGSVMGSRGEDRINTDSLKVSTPVLM